MLSPQLFVILWVHVRLEDIQLTDQFSDRLGAISAQRFSEGFTFSTQPSVADFKADVSVELAVVGLSDAPLLDSHARRMWATMVAMMTGSGFCNTSSTAGLTL